MAKFMKSQSQNRSISLPCRSHPNTSKMELELYKIKSCNTSSSTQNAKKITSGLSGLMDLFKCLEELLNLQMTKQALFHHQCEKFVNSLQDEFITLLDICGTCKDFMSHIKENCTQIQASFRTRRRKGDSSFENIVSENASFRKKFIKDAKKMILETKQMENKNSMAMISDFDHHVSSVIRSLQEVVVVTTTILNSIYLFVCAPISKPKTRWSVVSKLLQKGALVACENQVEDLNELQSLDIALEELYKSDPSEVKDEKKLHEVQNRLKSLEISIGDIENELECLFRGLIKGRVNLLNISSTHL